MYCGSCLSGNTLAGALRRAGDDVTLLPLYTPLKTDEENYSLGHVELGGINAFLNERWPRLKLPPFVRRWLDRPTLLRWAARFSSATRAEDLGALCVSVLRGEEGRQRAEVEKLVDWVAEHVRPELVHLNNALLVGLARELHRRLGVPVVTSLSGEDVFLERLPEPYRSEAKAVMRQRLGDCAGLAAMNDYYADFFATYVGVARERIAVIPPGLELRDFQPQATAANPPPQPLSRARARGDTRATHPTSYILHPTSLTIGFLARICADKGPHNLIEAAGRLTQEPNLPPWRVVAAGYLDPAERAYLAKCQQRADQLGLGERFQYGGELDRAAKVEFLRGLDVFCLPTDYQESKGLSVYEAWAAGVPAVLPAHGAFCEMVAATGGGLVYPPGNTAALTEQLVMLLQAADRRRELGDRARTAVFANHSAASLAERTRAWYRNVLATTPLSRTRERGRG